MMPSPGALLHQVNHHWCRKHNPIDPPTVIFEDGFETGTFEKWTGTVVELGTTLQVIAAAAHHGTYGAQAVCPGGYTWAYAYKDIGDYGILYMRGYFRSDALPTSDPDADIYHHILMSIRSYETTWLSLIDVMMHNDAGTGKWAISYSDAGVTKWAYGLGSWSVNTWYSVEIMAKIGATDGEVALWVDGTQLASYTGLDNDDQGLYVDRIHVGMLETRDVVTADWDCVSVQDVYIGPEVPPPVAGAKAMSGGLYLVFPA